MKIILLYREKKNTHEKKTKINLEKYLNKLLGLIQKKKLINEDNIYINPEQKPNG